MLQTVSDARRMLAPVFDQYGVSKAVLFGSIVKGTATAKSDLDLLVQSDLKGLKFVGLIEAVREAAGMPDVYKRQLHRGGNGLPVGVAPILHTGDISLSLFPVSYTHLT